MARQPKEIGDRTFRTKGSAEDYYRRILNACDIGRALDQEEFADLMNLLALHPRSEEKVGCGVQAITIELNDYGTRSFVLRRSDGSQEDFSYLKCIGGDHKPFAEFSRACRRSVELRLHTWKAAQMDGKVTKCAVTGQAVSFGEAHVDHKPPLTFSVIVKAFLTARNIDLTAVCYTRAGIFGVDLADSSLVAAFDDFHSKMAVLRIVRAEVNLRSAAAGRVTPTAKDGTLHG